MVGLRFVVLVLSLVSLPIAGWGAPVTVAGYLFANGEDDFAKSADVISGTVTGFSLAQVQTILTGSNVADSVRVIAPDVAEIELAFGGRQIMNSPGADFVVFELSGAQPAGRPDGTERFEVSLLRGNSFTAYPTVIPVSTGYVDPSDAALDVFAVLVDLDTFGFSANETTTRLRIRLVDNLVHRSADPTAVGLLHSVPEPSAFVLLGFAALVARVLAS